MRTSGLERLSSPANSDRGNAAYSHRVGRSVGGEDWGPPRCTRHRMDSRVPQSPHWAPPQPHSPHAETIRARPKRVDPGMPQTPNELKWATHETTMSANATDCKYMNPHAPSARKPAAQPMP